MRRSNCLLTVIPVFAFACHSPEIRHHQENAAVPDTTVHYSAEKHLTNVRQLTFGGDNAEAYFSFDGTKIVFQSTNKQWGDSCDQIYAFDLSKGNMKSGAPQMISTGDGRTTCAYFLPGDSLILYASTHEGSNEVLAAGDGWDGPLSVKKGGSYSRGMVLVNPP